MPSGAHGSPGTGSGAALDAGSLACETATDRRYGYGYGYGYYGARFASDGAEEVVARLAPIVRQIRRYDELRVALEEKGGLVKDLDAARQCLAKDVAVRLDYSTTRAKLIDQAGLRRLVSTASNGTVHLQVRQLETHMPVYYLCRIYEDYWDNCAFVVEDLHVSPGYPLDDDRFVGLMRGGHESFSVRLSPFRAAVIRDLAGPPASASSERSAGGASSWRVDSVLHSVGRHVFRSAWHEDQRPGVLAAAHFGIRGFREAIELLYLCLSSELCELRAAADERLVGFFDAIYPQPAIHGLLRRLSSLDGDALNEVPRTALAQYSRLSGAFATFLRIEVPWGSRGTSMPLYKLVYGNFPRLATVGRALEHEPAVAEARRTLESAAADVVAAIVGA